ncbi:MAG: integrase arm-type DNA-binding domain-containing protein, partial [Vibrio toranzoniae]
MAKKVQPLTATQIKQAKPKEKEYNLGDGDGLSLKIKPIGTKLWRFSYYHPISRKRLNL